MPALSDSPPAHDPLSGGSFGVLLRHLRRKARLTQRELGVAVGYSEAHIARLESDQRKPDPAAVTGRFIESLALEPDGVEAQRLVALAVGRHSTDTPYAAPSPGRGSIGRPTNLRSQLTGFVGRREDLAEVRRLLGAARLVTLTGPGGIGKSRLAAQTAAVDIDEYEGVWIVSFASLTQPEEVLNAVAATINVAGLDVLETLKRYLSERRALLVMDNCEHLITACAELSVTLLQNCPELTILATSREAMHVPGELTMSVGPMSCDEMHTLFVDRARAIRAEFEITPQNAPLLSHICDELEGLPLAAELVAYRLQALSLPEIVDMLDTDRFRLLSGGNRLAHPKHQSFVSLFDWSFDLLSESEQTLFLRLAAFEDDWTLENAETLTLGDALEGLTQLVKKSLVITDTSTNPTRYRMALRMLRAYALQKADERG
jgi:predicted ATPase